MPTDALTGGSACPQPRARLLGTCRGGRTAGSDSGRVPRGAPGAGPHVGWGPGSRGEVAVTFLRRPGLRAPGARPGSLRSGTPQASMTPGTPPRGPGPSRLRALSGSAPPRPEQEIHLWGPDWAAGVPCAHPPIALEVGGATRSRSALGAPGGAGMREAHNLTAEARGRPGQRVWRCGGRLGRRAWAWVCAEGLGLQPLSEPAGGTARPRAGPRATPWSCRADPSLPESQAAAGGQAGALARGHRMPPAQGPPGMSPGPLGAGQGEGGGGTGPRTPVARSGEGEEAGGEGHSSAYWPPPQGQPPWREGPLAPLVLTWEPPQPPPLRSGHYRALGHSRSRTATHAVLGTAIH